MGQPVHSGFTADHVWEPLWCLLVWNLLFWNSEHFTLSISSEHRNHNQMWYKSSGMRSSLGKWSRPYQSETTDSCVRQDNLSCMCSFPIKFTWCVVWKTVSVCNFAPIRAHLERWTLEIAKLFIRCIRILYSMCQQWIHTGPGCIKQIHNNHEKSFDFANYSIKHSTTTSTNSLI